MTLTRIAQVLAGFGLLLGLVHLGMLALIQGGAPAQRLWFAGTGLAIVFAAVMNLIALAVHGRMVAWIALGASLSMVALFLAALPVLEGPQALVGLAVFTGLSILSIARGVLFSPTTAKGIS